MRNLVPWLLLCSGATVATGCHGDDPAPSIEERSAPQSAPQHAKQVPPPLDLQTPPADASKTGSGLVYKQLVTQRDGAQLAAGHTAMIRYTGWRQRTGETFFTTGDRGQAIAIDPAHTAPAFREALPLLHRGEKLMLWVPETAGGSEPVVYAIELVDVVAPAPTIAEPASTAAKK